jgi:hypothetical protein
VNRRVKRGHTTPAGDALDPRRSWRAIVVATLILVPGFWSMLAGLVSLAADEAEGGPDPAAAIALGFAVIPFVFVAAAFMSAHPNPPMAVLKAMGLSLVVGPFVSAIAADAVTGIVAGVGAGAIVTLRMPLGHRWPARAAAVAFASLYTMVLVRTVGDLALLSAPVFPFTAVGLADHWVERRQQRAEA